MDLTKVPVLRKELEFITAHPEHWSQSSWYYETSCGTAGCLAGNAVAHSSEFTIHKEEFLNSGDYSFNAIRCSDGEYQSWDRAGAEVLGLTWEEGQKLFSGANTLRKLWILANEFSEGQIDIPLDLPHWAGVSIVDGDLPE